MLSILISFLFLTKDSKARKIHFFSVKTGSGFSCLFNFCSLNDAKKKLHNNVPEMFGFNPKMSIWKYPISSRRNKFFSVNVSDFYRHFTAKN